MSAIDEAVARAARESQGYGSARRVIEILQAAALDLGAAVSSDGDPRALFAGGCVRDWASGKIPKDLDIATALGPDDVIRSLRRAIKGCGTQVVGKHFGVVRVRPERDGAWFEVATFREEGPYTDHRHPSTVSWTSRTKDALRRDFTVNGLYFDPVSERVFDDVGGLEDLRTSTLRAIGDPERRFEEDALRLMRAIRFAARENYVIDSITMNAMRAHADLLATVSPERIHDELARIASLGPNQMARAFTDMKASRLFEVIWRITCEDRLPYPSERSLAQIEDVLSSMHALPMGPMRISACVGAWFVETVRMSESHAAWKKTVLSAARALRMSTEESDLLVGCLHGVWISKGSGVIDDFRARRCAAHPLVVWLLAFADACGVSSQSRLRIGEARVALDAGYRIKPWLNGSELMELGVPEGPALGRMTRWLLAKQYRGDIQDGGAARELVVERIKTLRMP